MCVVITHKKFIHPRTTSCAVQQNVVLTVLHTDTFTDIGYTEKMHFEIFVRTNVKRKDGDDSITILSVHVDKNCVHIVQKKIKACQTLYVSIQPSMAKVKCCFDLIHQRVLWFTIWLFHSKTPNGVHWWRSLLNFFFLPSKHVKQ